MAESALSTEDRRDLRFSPDNLLFTQPTKQAITGEIL